MKKPARARQARALPFPCIPFNFCGIEENADFRSAAAVVLPVPCETGPPTVGASQAPFHVIAASREAELYDMELGCEIHGKGIYTHGELALDQGHELAPLGTIEECTGFILDAGKFPLLIGGDRAVTLGALPAFKARCRDLRVVLLSGRADLEEQQAGRALAPRSVGRGVVSSGLETYLVGFRRAAPEQLARVLELPRVRAVGAGEILEAGRGLDELLGGVRGNVYLSIDVNVFDPSIMPIPCNPEPGGLTWDHVTSILRLIFSRSRVQGCDIVGFAPAAGSVLPDQVAARLAMKIIGYRFFLKQKRPRRSP